jgi:hypothetical protein
MAGKKHRAPEQPEGSWRIYWAPSDPLPRVVCVDEFDEGDYHEDRFLSRRKFGSRAEVRKFLQDRLGSHEHWMSQYEITIIKVLLGTVPDLDATR